ncbi:MAG: FAD-dependent oxidoreductase [Burkholderiaceae bacterium]
MTANPVTDYQSVQYQYQTPPELQGEAAVRRGVVVVGAGPVGLSVAIDLAQRGIDVLLLDDDYRLSSGSRAICFSKRTLEIFDHLGCGERMVDKGVDWKTGKVFLRDEMVYSFDLQPEPGHKRPAFINLQQYYAEGFLVERALQMPNIEIRWRNKVSTLREVGEQVLLGIETPDGDYDLAADWVIACDGARSPIRSVLGLESRGRVFRDRFLIADIRMKADFPTERRFWFNPPFHPDWSVLMHKQPDDIWRIDFQLGWDADPEQETRHENVQKRVKAVLGEDVPFELEWVSIYTFACKRMDRFRKGRVIFAGDSAHGVSPFGARGANSGVQDAENLAWKLARVMQGLSPESLLDSYDSERVYAADENILNSTRATDFITPKSAISKVFRNAVLELSRRVPFARALVNSGRLSVPATLHDSPLNTPDTEPFAGRMVPGATALDAPVVTSGGDPAWLIDRLVHHLCLLVAAGDDLTPDRLSGVLHKLREFDAQAGLCVIHRDPPSGLPAVPGIERLHDAQGLVTERYDLQPGTVYLLRPDQHVSGRSRQLEAGWLDAAIRRTLGWTT